MPGAHETETPPAWELYDLQADPHEMRNAYADPRYAEVIRDLKAQLKILRREWGDTDLGRPRMQEILADFWDR